MKLLNYQEDLLKKIPSVERRRLTRNKMKSITKSLRSYEILITEYSGTYHKQLMIGVKPKFLDDWQRNQQELKEQLLKIESQLREQN